MTKRKSGWFASIFLFLYNKGKKEKDRTISELRVTVEELRTMVTDLRCTIANLNETLDEFKRKFFGTSSEKTKKGQSEDLSAQDTEP